MSRHRIVRTMDYKDEYDSYDDVYGHSVDDDNCISPTDASQWIYDRAKGQQSISAFMANNRNIEEEDEDKCSENDDGDNENKKRRDSENYQMPVLNDVEQAKLLSCIDEIRSVVGDAISERQIVETAMKYEYDVTKTLDAILNSTSSTPPLSESQEIGVAAKSLKNVAIGIEKDSKENLIEKRNHSMSKLDMLIKNKLKISSSNLISLPKVNVNPQTSIASLSPTSTNSSKLSQFLSDRLNKATTTSSSIENTTSTTVFSKTNFILPKLKLKSNLNSSIQNNFSETYNQMNNNENNIKDTRKMVNKLSVNDSNNKTFEIDFTKLLIDNNLKKDEAFESKHKSKVLAIHHTNTIELSLDKCDLMKASSNHHKCEFFSEEPSQFGKILSLKYKCKNMPYIKFDFNPMITDVTTTDVKPFNFETKSPDDLHLEWLKKAKMNSTKI